MKREDLPYLRGIGSGAKVIPDVLYIGRSEVQWPMQVWQCEAHALYWLQHPEPNYPRHVYRMDLITGDVVELELVTVSPYLRAKPGVSS
jgi:hypothetical protein